jgi:hypothetical protein
MKGLDHEHLPIHRAHESEKPFHCKECMNRYESEYKLLRHRHSNHPRSESWICSRVRWNRVFFNEITQFEDTQTSSKVYVFCGYCGTTCSIRNRKSHVEEVHGIPRCSASTIFFRSEDFCQHLSDSHAATPNPFMEQLVERAHRKATHQVPVTVESTNKSNAFVMTSLEDLEDAILFQRVSIAHLDESADDYKQRLEAFEANKLDLERQLAFLRSGRPLVGLISESDERQDAITEVLDDRTPPEDDSQVSSEIKDESLPHNRIAQVSGPEHRIPPVESEIARIMTHAAQCIPNPPLSTVVNTRNDQGVDQCHVESQETAQGKGNHTPRLPTYHIESTLVTLLQILTRWCRPMPWRNHSRLEWHCYCGRQFWGDFKSDEPEKLHRLAFELEKHGFTVDAPMETATASGTSSTTKNTSSSQNTTTSASTSSQNAAPIVKQGTSISPSGTTPPAVRQTTVSAPVSLLSINKPVYLELCINRSSRVTQLGEIIIVDGRGKQLINTDLELFGKCFVRSCLSPQRDMNNLNR